VEWSNGGSSEVRLVVHGNVGSVVHTEDGVGGGTSSGVSEKGLGSLIN
jgi:hypothetical protein